MTPRKKKRIQDDWFKDVETGKWVHIVVTNLAVYRNGKKIAAREEL